MENAAKALGIAAGVLLAVILMSLIAYFFSNISEWPQQQDDMESAEQLAKFNKEYEVYEKSQMYGVDVISCLNKAKSNNEKYVNAEGFLNGTKYDQNYTVDVCVRIKSELDEDMLVYFVSPLTNKEELITSSTGLKLKDALPSSISDKFDPSSYYTKFNKNDELQKITYTLSDSSKYMVPGGGNEIYNGKNYYSLINDNQVEKLINLVSTTPKTTIKNNGTNLDKWSKVIWTTALYKFKTKRFECDAINYNSTTGRIDKIYFSEYPSKDY